MRALAFVLALVGGLLGMTVGVYFVVVGEEAAGVHFYASSLITILGVSLILSSLLGLVCGFAYRRGSNRFLAALGLVVAAAWSLLSLGVFSAALFLLAALLALVAGNRPSPVDSHP